MMYSKAIGNFTVNLFLFNVGALFVWLLTVGTLLSPWQLGGWTIPAPAGAVAWQFWTGAVVAVVWGAAGCVYWARWTWARSEW